MRVRMSGSRTLGLLVKACKQAVRHGAGIMGLSSLVDSWSKATRVLDERDPLRHSSGDGDEMTTEVEADADIDKEMLRETRTTEGMLDCHYLTSFPPPPLLPWSPQASSGLRREHWARVARWTRFADEQTAMLMLVMTPPRSWTRGSIHLWARERRAPRRSHQRQSRGYQSTAQACLANPFEKCHKRKLTRRPRRSHQLSWRVVKPSH